MAMPDGRLAQIHDEAFGWGLDSIERDDVLPTVPYSAA